MKHGLTESEQRGYLTYMRPNYSFATDMAGWYRVEGNTVVRRKVGGRNWSAFCPIESVESFDLYDAEGEKVTREIRARLARLHAQ